MRTMKRHTARLAVQEGYDPAKVVSRLCHFHRRYKVSATRAGRLRKESEDVQVAKCRMFHWFMQAVGERFAPDIADIVNADECPVSPSGQMNPQGRVFTFGHEADAQLRNAKRAVTHSLADMKYRFGSFIPFVGKGVRTWPKNAMLLFKGGTRDPKENFNTIRRSRQVSMPQESSQKSSCSTASFRFG